MPAGGSTKTNRSGIVRMVGAAIGGLLLDALHFPAAAASAQSGADRYYFTYEMELYLRQFVQWILVGIDSTLHAYHLDANQLYEIVLTLFVLAIFACLMVKAFTLGKLAAERMSRGR